MLELLQKALLFRLAWCCCNRPLKLQVVWVFHAENAVAETSSSPPPRPLAPQATIFQELVKCTGLEIDFRSFRVAAGDEHQHEITTVS